MRSLFIVIALSCFGNFAHAWGEFSFRLGQSSNPGCLKVDSISTPYDFPDYDKGKASTVRFFFSNKYSTDVTEASDYQSSGFIEGKYDQYSLDTDEFCGFAKGRWYVKYGLYDADGNLLEFMDPNDWSSYSNSITVN